MRELKLVEADEFLEQLNQKFGTVKYLEEFRQEY